MNCKQGDLAIIVRAYNPENLGKIVTCIRLIQPRNWREPNGSISEEPTWEIDIPLRGFSGNASPLICDFQLRPIRDNDGKDEMLHIAGLPNKHPEAA